MRWTDVHGGDGMEEEEEDGGECMAALAAWGLGSLESNFPVEFVRSMQGEGEEGREGGG